MMMASSAEKRRAADCSSSSSNQSWKVHEYVLYLLSIVEVHGRWMGVEMW